MALCRLSLTDFRSYADALIAPGPGLVVLTGGNGAGKTNVLEAGSLLQPCCARTTRPRRSMC